MLLEKTRGILNEEVVDVVVIIVYLPDVRDRVLTLILFLLDKVVDEFGPLAQLRKDCLLLSRCWIWVLDHISIEVVNDGIGIEGLLAPVLGDGIFVTLAFYYSSLLLKLSLFLDLCNAYNRCFANGLGQVSLCRRLVARVSLVGR